MRRDGGVPAAGAPVRSHGGLTGQEPAAHTEVPALHAKCGACEVSCSEKTV